MKSKETFQLSSVLLTLANINDNLRKTNETLEQINNKLNELDIKKEMTIKHIVLSKKEK